MNPTEQATHLPHRKFLERLLTLSEGRTKFRHKLTPSARDFIGISTGVSGLHFRYVIGLNESRVELYIARPDATDNKRIFDELESHRHEIEAAFEGLSSRERLEDRKLSWERLEGRKSSRITCRLSNGGSEGDEARWETVQHPMIDAMTRLEEALRPFISKLRTSS
ncbi:MAG TPA: DUF4268 domain-containing protein [Pyrinomonadaceae bacterium]|nr:DUF4268 domain-containing protein [Pyrinomonadaceae bacterium]